MTVVRYVLVKVRPGVSLDEFEKFEREVDYVKAMENPSIVSYRTHRIEDLDPGIDGGPWDFMERIEVTSRAEYEKQAASGSKEFLDLLYSKWLDRSKTVAIWSELSRATRRNTMAIVRYVFAALKPGVDPEVYERYEREVDYAVAAKMKTIVSYRTHRLTERRRHLGRRAVGLSRADRDHRPRRLRRGDQDGRRGPDRRALREVSRQGEDQVGLDRPRRSVSEIAVLAGKVALVTGSSSGAGVAIARELARHGARVAVHCRSAINEAVTWRARIRKSGGDAAASRPTSRRPMRAPRWSTRSSAPSARSRCW